VIEQRRPSPASIEMAHGSGGKRSRDLTKEIFLRHFGGEELGRLDDQARFDLASLAAAGDRLALTTDSYVVTPLFFSGGDIGRLAVHGTVNDLAVGGAIPKYLTCGFILEEGLSTEVLERVVVSMAEAAREADVEIVAGDTKVVPRGAADGLFVNTAGVGVIPGAYRLDARGIRPGDRILLSGTIGDHGAAVVDARGELALEIHVQSDCQPLHRLTAAMLAASASIRCMRDATRGGLATVLNEFAVTSGRRLRVHEEAIPVREAVRGVCELLGLDPLYLANEGKLVAICPPADADAVLAAMRARPEGADSTCIGEVSAGGRAGVLLTTAFGAERMVDLLVGDQLPRIC
jgi:hydrogenase expression/formation protein HypE